MAQQVNPDIQSDLNQVLYLWYSWLLNHSTPISLPPYNANGTTEWAIKVYNKITQQF